MAEQAESTVEYVQIDGLVLLKIIKHCHDQELSTDNLVQGVLLGLVEGKKLEVTHCFSFPRHNEDEDFDAVSYQMEMMRNLRNVNVDHLHVGWYQSSFNSNHLNKALLDSQFNYQHSIEESIVLVYDPEKSSKGQLSLKALRMTPLMMQMYEKHNFKTENVKSKGLSYNDMFEEIPTVIKNSHLVNAALCEIEAMQESTKAFNYMSINTGSTLEKQVQLLMGSVDELGQEAHRYYTYYRQLGKQQMAKQQYISKRKQENEQRLMKGESALPDEDLGKLFKAPAPPQRLEALLTSSQIDLYTKEINNFASQSLGKLFMADQLQDHNLGVNP